ncbi:MAG TPA: cytochrome c biogenesis protein CcsA [Bacillota bacterium]|nr:cytochrome c biogenesis protein CcsA [Bacillota bacterium]
MNIFEAVFVWSFLFLDVVIFAVYLAGMLFRKGNWTFYAWGGFLGTFALQTAAIASRWIASGHPPVQGNWENALLGAWFISLVFVVGSLKFEKLRFITPFIAAVVLLVIGIGLIKGGTQMEVLTPPYRSNWLWIHVTFAFLALASFVAAAALAGNYLWKICKAEQVPAVTETTETAKSPEATEVSRPEWNPAETERLIAAFLGYGFISQTLDIASGAIWAANLWGAYWSWDPIETASFICWLAYGVVLHLRLTLGWKGKRFAWLAVLALLTSIISFWGLGTGGGIHTPLM